MSISKPLIKNHSINGSLDEKNHTRHDKIYTLLIFLVIALFISSYFAWNYWSNNINIPDGFYRLDDLPGMVIPVEVSPQIAQEIAEHYETKDKRGYCWIKRSLVINKSPRKIISVWTIEPSGSKDWYFHPSLIEEELNKEKAKPGP